MELQLQHQSFCFSRSDGTRCCDLRFVCLFLMLSFKTTFSLSSFTLIKRLLNFSSLSAVRGGIIYMEAKVLVAQLCLTLFNPWTSVHQAPLASILEWVAISSSMGSSRPRDRTQVSHTAGRFFTLSHLGSLLCSVPHPPTSCLPRTLECDLIWK